MFLFLFFLFCRPIFYFFTFYFGKLFLCHNNFILAGSLIFEYILHNFRFIFIWCVSCLFLKLLPVLEVLYGQNYIAKEY